MRIAYLAFGHSVHTVRWMNALAERGHEMHLLTCHPVVQDLSPRVEVHRLPVPPPLGYFLNAPRVRAVLREIKPHLLHAHYASGYGTLGRLSRFHPWVLSVWGTDVYGFPTRSPLHRRIIARNLAAADWVCSTSHAMAEVTGRLHPHLAHLAVTPFGIDTTRFVPAPDRPSPAALTVGTVKTLESKYGIDLLIRAFARARQALGENFSPPLRLLIVGGGSREGELKRLVAELGLPACTEFTGRVPFAEVPRNLQRLDIYVAASRCEESFGVAILEACACGLPVVVANVGGLPEVVRDGETGIVVPREDVPALSEAIVHLLQDPALRARMGARGREHVQQHYEWQVCVDLMEGVYARVRETQGGRITMEEIRADHRGSGRAGRAGGSGLGSE